MLDEICPEKLYKYFSSNRFKFLVDRLVRYTPLDAFNDPFEGRPDLLEIISQKDLDKQFEAVVEEQALLTYSKLPDSHRKLISYENFTIAIRKEFDKNKGFFLQQANKFTPSLSSKITAVLNNSLGAFCLSEVYDDLLMWAHYASSHEGFVVEFDAKHSYFNSRRSERDEFYYLRKVNYEENRPSAGLSAMKGPEFFLVKSDHWKYEKEWRIFRLLTEADEVERGIQYDVHLFKIPSDAITGIIFGARSSVEMKEKIKGIIEKDSDLAHILLKQAKPDENRFKINIFDI